MIQSGEDDSAVMLIGEDGFARIIYDPDEDLSIEEIARQSEKDHNVSGATIKYAGEETTED